GIGVSGDAVLTGQLSRLMAQATPSGLFVGRGVRSVERGAGLPVCGQERPVFLCTRQRARRISALPRTPGTLAPPVIPPDDGKVRPTLRAPSVLRRRAVFSALVPWFVFLVAMLPFERMR